MLIDDFNAEESEPVLLQFLYDSYAVVTANQNACRKSINSPSCINLTSANIPNSFQNTATLYTGLSDFYTFSETVLKTSFRKTAPKALHYKDNNKFHADDFKTELI